MWSTWFTTEDLQVLSEHLAERHDIDVMPQDLADDLGDGKASGGYGANLRRKLAEELGLSPDEAEEMIVRVVGRKLILERPCKTQKAEEQE